MHLIPDLMPNLTGRCCGLETHQHIIKKDLQLDIDTNDLLLHSDLSVLRVLTFYYVHMHTVLKLFARIAIKVNCNTILKISRIRGVLTKIHEA